MSIRLQKEHRITNYERGRARHEANCFPIASPKRAQVAWLRTRPLYKGLVRLCDQELMLRPLVHIQGEDVYADAVTGTIYEGGGRCLSTSQLQLQKVTPDRAKQMEEQLLALGRMRLV